MSLRPEPFGSELKAELLRPRGSSTCLKAELLTARAHGRGQTEGVSRTEGEGRKGTWPVDHEALKRGDKEYFP
jgi:hypothetical protein